MILLLNPLAAKKKLLVLSFAILSVLQSSAQAPVITSFSPSSGPVGTVVTISGSNFSASAGNNIVYFGAVKTAVTSATSTSLTVTVPPGATYQPFTVTTNHLTAWSPRPFLTTFAGGDAPFTRGSFVPAIDVATNLHPNGVVIVDLDGDGISDLATSNNANSPASLITVCRNTSSGGVLSFANKIDLAAPPGSLPSSIAAADIDGDGLQDLVVTNNVSKTMSVYRNTSTPGTISFAARVEFATGDAPMSVATGDLDGDGKPDVAVTNFLSNTVSIFKNTGTTGTIAFASKNDLTAGLSPHTVAIGDLDGDGKPDLAVTNALSTTVSLFRNQSSSGTIAFATKTDMSTGTDEPSGIAIGDLDGDNKSDLVITNDNFSFIAEATVSMSVWKNTSSSGSFSFTLTGNYDAGNTYNASLGDLNGDGKPEVILARSTISALFYPNTSTAGNIQLSTAVIYYANSPYSIAAGDLDGDNMPDLAVANFTSQTVSILKNKVAYPAIVSFTPTIAATGTTVTISGSNFTGTKAVSFGGVPATSFTVTSPTSITAVVGAGASGHVTVTNGVGADSAANFVFAGPPIVSSFTPNIGFVGASITITGYNFTGCTGVSFGGRPAAYFTVVSPTSIAALVDSGATGDVSVSTLYGTGTKAGFTFIPPPVLSSFTPSSARSGDTVMITGANLATATNVSFGPLPAGSFTVVSPTLIKAVVAAGSTGAVTVRTIGGSASLNGFKFITGPPPVISSFSPVSGSAGTTVVVQGLNFNTAAANNIVYFGPYRAQVSAASANSLTVIVPSGAQLGPITVINTGNGLQAVSAGFFTPLYSKIVAIDSNTFAHVKHFDDDYQSWNSSLADFDGDGKMDVAGQSLNSTVSIKRNTSAPGDLSFAPEQQYNITSPYPGGNFVGPTTAADIDGDGRMDIVAVDYIVNDTCYIGVLRNTSTPGQISFEDEVKFKTVVNAFALTIADVDGDGRPDILVQGQGASGILLNNSSIGVTSFLPQQDFPFPAAIAAFGDFNNDGKIDGVSSGNYFSGSSVSILENTSSVGMTSFTSVPLFTPEYQHDPIRISVADLDGDEKLDLLIANGDGANYGFRTICRNTSTGNTISFEIKETALPKIIQNGIAGDIDGDGKPDMIVSTAYESIVGVARNTSTPGNISFADDLWYPSRVSAFGLSAADMDGDGKPDLVASGYASALGFSVLLNKGGQRPSISAVGDTVFCEGDSVLLLSSLPYSNQWYENGVAIPGANNDSLMVYNGGTYTNATSTSELSDALLVVFHPVPDKPSITRDVANGTLVSSSATGNQWYGDFYNEIAGANGQSYKPTANGKYFVQVSENGCSSPFSNAYNYVITAIIDLGGNGKYLRIAPNPVHDFAKVTFNYPGVYTVGVELLDMNGRVMLTRKDLRSDDMLNTSGLAAGVYVLKVYSSNRKINVTTLILKI